MARDWRWQETTQNEIRSSAWFVRRPLQPREHCIEARPDRGIEVFLARCGSAMVRRVAATIDLHRVEGVQVAVYSPGKTVADCYKFRRKIGLDVALEALRECWRDRRADMDELWRFAKICRVANVMRPYLESLE